jgi:hypothetical protein
MKSFLYLLKLDEISGWPRVPVLSKSSNEIMVFFLITCICLLLPIFISCSIYLKLICNKNKWFLNEITFEENNQENIYKNKPDGSTRNSESNKIETGNEMEMQKILDLHTEQKKCQAQILAAERSLLTNLVLGTLFLHYIQYFNACAKNVTSLFNGHRHINHESSHATVDHTSELWNSSIYCQPVLELH